jgi:hypothetical protein
MIRSLLLFTLCITLIVVSKASAIYLSLDFAVDRQTYDWTDSLSVSRQLSQALKFDFYNRSRATLIQESVLGQGSDRWQRNANTAANLTRQLSSKLNIGARFEQRFDRLERKRYIGNNFLMTSLYKSNLMRLEQSAGLLWEERRFEPEVNNQTGLEYNAAMRLQPTHTTRWGSFGIDGGINTLRKTPNKEVSFDYALPLLAFARDTVSLTAEQRYAQQKYYPSSGNFETVAVQDVEQRRWDFRGVKQLPAMVRARLDASYHFDKYDYNYEGDTGGLIRQNNNVSSRFDYKFALQRDLGSSLTLGSGYEFSRTDEDYGTDQTNQRAETGQFTSSATFRYWDTDSLQLSGRIGVTSYTAPTASAFFADRDRSIKVATVTLYHRFNEFLSGYLDGSYRGFHTIYISGTLSANNNINNVYIINPSLVWQPWKHLRIRQNYQMHANYIYYEFEKNATSDRNTLYRRANFSNSIDYVFSQRLTFSLEYSYRYEDFGKLIWQDQWEQQVSWDRRTHRPGFAVEYRPMPQLYFSPFASYEIQKSYDHNFSELDALGRRDLSSRLKRSSVGFKFQWSLSNNSYIDASLERKVQDYLSQRRLEYDVFTMTARRYW